MSIRVGINGLGRVGRSYVRRAAQSEDLEVVAVNDVADAKTLRNLLRRDSTFGRFDLEVALDGSLVDLGVILDREASVQDINDAFAAAAADGPLAGRLRYEDEPFVSCDVIGDSACVFDASLTQAAGRFVKVFGWYDNEWGYTCRLADLTRLVGQDVHA